MRDYRAYILGIEGHRFLLVKDFSNDYPNDDAALSAAKRLTDTHDVEVWEGARLVARFSPSEVTSSGLAPHSAPAAPTDCEKESIVPAEPDPVRGVLELATCILEENASN